MFDRPAANNERAEGGSEGAAWTLGHMEAADARMKEVIVTNVEGDMRALSLAAFARLGKGQSGIRCRI
jgi:hypothetical protein